MPYLQINFLVACCFILFCVNKSSAPAEILAIIQSSSDKGSFITGLNVTANNKYIQGKNDPLLLNATKNPHINTPVATIRSTV